MQPPSLPDGEVQRLAILRDLGILDTPAEERFDLVTRVARMLFEVPIALVSLVDEDRQWFKSKQGLPVCETSRDISFCGHAIHRDAPLVVPDALSDERFADNPLVTSEPHIRFYAGVPLTSEAGERLGTLCIIDRKPRRLAPADVAALQDLAQLAQNELRTSSPSTVSASQTPDEIDAATGAWAAGALQQRIDQELDSERKPVALLAVRMCGFADIAEHWVDDDGALLMAELAQVVRREIGPNAIVGRTADDRLVAALFEDVPELTRGDGTRLNLAARTSPVLNAFQIDIDSAVLRVRPEDASAEALLDRVHTALEVTH